MFVTLPHPIKLSLTLISVEFGVVGAIGALYPTSGFSAAYTLAHEIGNYIIHTVLQCIKLHLAGHLLGMGHDGNVGCDWSEYIMSKSRADHGQTSWSSCSKASLASQSVMTPARILH